MNRILRAPGHARTTLPERRLAHVAITGFIHDGRTTTDTHRARRKWLGERKAEAAAEETAAAEAEAAARLVGPRLPAAAAADGAGAGDYGGNLRPGEGTRYVKLWSCLVLVCATLRCHWGHASAQVYTSHHLQLCTCMPCSFRAPLRRLAAAVATMLIVRQSSSGNKAAQL